MDAIDRFWAAVTSGEIPVAFPVRDVGSGMKGLSTAGVPIGGNQDAEFLLYSEDWRNRAAGAVMAIEHAIECSVEPGVVAQNSLRSP